MEKRVILAFVLSIAVMYAFTALYSPRHAPEPVPGVQSSPPVASVPGNQKRAVPSTPVEKTETTASVAEEESREEKAEDFAVDRLLFTARISICGDVLQWSKFKAN